MPRPKKAGAPEPKKRSRNGCWPCKSRKVKCDEAHPACLNCQRQGELCDYSIRLNWEGRGKKKTELLEGTGQINFSSNATAETRPKSSQGIWSEEQRPVTSSSSYTEPRSMIDPRIPTPSTTADPPESYSSNNRDHKRRLILPASSQGRVTQPAMNLVRTGLSSPSDLNYGSPNNLSFASLTLPASQNAVVPTQPIYGKMFEEDHSAFERRSKRTRYEYASDCIKPVREYEMPPPYGPFAYGGSNTSSPASAFMFSSGHPSIPTAPSTPSDDAYKSNVNKLSPFATQESSDPRRLSVESLLSGPPGMGSDSTMTNNRGSISDIQSPLTSLDQEELTTWGIDRGFKDLDMPKNDDLNAISGGSPAIRREEPEWFANAHDEYSPIEFGFGVQAKDTAFEGGGYYAQSIPIQIPRSFEPLPAVLIENPMNLLYFHHFISHTARILVPHHCSSNPFQNILPKMALRDPNLMSLLLAYSASHRARLLKQPEPATRIALWVQDIFPALRHALDDPNGVVSLSSLAAAIMLASLEIISPKAFGVEVSWRQHLETARQLIAARGGWKMMNQDQSPVTNFLLRWFAYLDVVGGLVGGAMDLPSSHAMAMEIGYQVDDRLEEDRIDCLFGFTTRCITILAKIADLARMCSRNRLDPDYNLGRAWEPSETIKEQADMLIRDTEDAMVKTSIKPCPHLHANGEAADQWDNVQITAVNDAFHWAGLIHLHRRVLGKASSHPDVQKSVRAILGTLFKVKRGSTAEACLLFPMFTAGCDAEDENHKAIIMDRLTGAGEFGMSQAHKARKLMELVWETGKPWERLVAGEFVG